MCSIQSFTPKTNAMELLDIKETLDRRIDEISSLVAITNKSSVLVIKQFPHDKDEITLIPPPLESISNVLCFVELGSSKIAEAVINMMDGIVDYIIVDEDLKLVQSQNIIDACVDKTKKSKLFFFSDTEAWINAALTFIQQVCNGIYDKKIAVLGEGILFQAFSQKLKNMGSTLVGKNDIDLADLVVGANIKKQLELPIIKLKPGVIFFDLGLGNFSPETINRGIEEGATFYRSDMRAGISSTVLRILETDYLLRNMMGTTKIAGVEVAAGGVIGAEGAIILDDISKPSYLFGVANGDGTFKKQLSKADEERIKIIQNII